MNTIRTAFSLVEVLMAVLILAIGLLGLGAVIPVVVREQRLAADAVQGITVMKTARETATRYMLGEPGRAWLSGQQWSRPADDFPWHDWRDTGGDYGVDLSTGDMLWFRDGDPISILPVRQRLWPSPAILGAGASSDDGVGLYHRPQFVWDLAARRVQTAAGAPQQMQVVIFVRRIDPNIRLPRRQRELSLYEVLTGNLGPGVGAQALQPGERRLPVAVDPNGRPTRSGTNGQTGPLATNNAYAAPVVVGVQVDLTDPTRRTLELIGNPVLRQLASQPGQRLVDNLGNIYVVRRVESPTRVEVDPAVPSGLSATQYPNIHQVIFTPQVPAAVSVFTVTRPDMPTP